MMLQCPDCKQQIALPSDQITDSPARCPECRSALPPKLLIPRGLKIRETQGGAILRSSRFARGKTFFYLTGFTLIILLTEPVTRHWRDHNFSTIWVEAIFGVLAVGALAWLIYELCGKDEIRETGGKLTLFTGVGPIGVNRRFEVYDIADIKLVTTDMSDKSRTGCHLALTLANGQSFTFFNSINRDALQYFCIWLRQKTNLT